MGGWVGVFMYKVNCIVWLDIMLVFNISIILFEVCSLPTDHQW